MFLGQSSTISRAAKFFPLDTGLVGFCPLRLLETKLTVVIAVLKLTSEKDPYSPTPHDHTPRTTSAQRDHLPLTKMRAGSMMTTANPSGPFVTP